MLALILVFLLTVAPISAVASEPLRIAELALKDTGTTLEVVITTSGTITPKLTQFVNPSKVILEFAGASLAQHITAPSISHPAVQGIRLSSSPAGVKLAVDLNFAVPRAELVQESPTKVRLAIPVIFEESSTARVAPGVLYTQLTRGTLQGPLEINVLRIDPKVSRIRVETRLAGNQTLGRAPLSAIATEAGALAAINGSFFGVDGTPLGLFIQDGRLVTEPTLERTALAVTTDGTLLITPFSFTGSVTLGSLVLPVSGLNRQRYNNELIVYTSDRSESTRTNSFGRELVIIDGVVAGNTEGNSLIPENGYVLSGHGVFKELFSEIQVGTPCSLELATDPHWRDVGIQFAVGAGPLLVSAGQVSVTGTQERFQNDVIKGRAPRAALGVSSDGQIVAVTVNGRLQGVSVGMTLTELAELMVNLGAERALNLDGGGSATMVIRGRPLNMPSDGKERQVSSGIVFVVNPDKESI